jgi:hypothetical protein
MTFLRTIAVLATGGLLVLVAWLSVLAQTPRSPSRVGSADVAPALPPARSAPTFSIPNAVQPAFGTTTLPPSSPHPAPTSSLYYTPSSGEAAAGVTVIPVKLELRSELVLEGKIEATGPYPCGTTFGEVSIPWEKMRGIRVHEGENTLGMATVVLDNSDALTVTMRAAQIQIRTEWGMAVVEMPYVRSLILTADAVRWQQVEGKWRLAPVEKAAPDEDRPPALENPAAEQLPALPRATM